MSTIQKYFKRVPKNSVQNNVYARSLKRKLSALNVEESNCGTSKKTNSELDERECILVSTDKNLPLNIASVSTNEINSFLRSEQNGKFMKK